MNRITPSPSARIIKSRSVRRTLSAVAIALVTLGGVSAAFAATKNWAGPSPGTTTAPASGIWDASSLNWNTGSGAGNAAFTSASDAAVFGGADGAYGIKCGTLTATTITFNNSGYTLTNSAAVTVTANAGGNSVNVASGKTATIGTNVTLSITGNGGFINAGTTFGGQLIIDSGGTITQPNSFAFSIDGAAGSMLRVLTGGVASHTGGGSGVRIGAAANTVATLSIEGGVFNNTGSATFAIGNGAGAIGVVSVASGTLNVPNTPILLGNSATALATNNLNGGIEISRQVKLGAAGAVSIFNFNGGTLKGVNPGIVNLTNAFMVGLTAANVRNNGGIIDCNGTPIIIGQALVHSTLSGDAATDGGLIVTNSLAGGSLALTNANTYNGPTIVRKGARLVTTSLSIGAGSYTVDDGGTLEVQVAGAGQSLTGTSLTLGTSGNVTNNFTLGANASTTNPAMTVSGALNLNSTVNVTVTGTGLSGPNTYLLMSYGSISGAGSFVAGALPAVAGYVATLTNDTAAKQLQLIYTPAPQPVKWAVGGGSWDTSSLNWQLLAGSGATNYVENAFVAFDESASGSDPITVTLAGNRSPTVISNNSTKSYIITGSSGIIGNPALVKDGSGTLSLNNSGANAIANATINSGKLQVGNGGLTGTTVTNNAALSFNPTTSISVGTISGTGTVTKSGAGTVTLSAAATHSGITTIDGGRLLLAGDAASTTVSNNVAGGLGFSGITSASIGGLAGTGDIGLTNAVGAAVTLTAGGNNATTAYGGSVTGAGGVLHKAGTGTLALSGTVSGLNNLDISSGAGTLAITGGSVITTNLQVNGVDGIIAISSGTVSVPTDSRISAGGGVVNVSGGTHHFNKIVVANGTGTANAAMTVSGNAQMIQDGSLTTGNADRQLWVGGNNSATSGSLTLKDNASWINSQPQLDDLNGNPMVVVGNNGNCQGTFTIQDNAAFSYTNLLRVARNSGNVGTVNLNGGTISVRGFERQAGTGAVNINGGTIKALVTVSDYFSNFTGTGGNNSVNLQSGGLTFDTSLFVVTLGNVLSGAGGLTKVGNGTLYLNGANTYLGATLVSAGTLGGNGSIAGALTVSSGATLAPGTSIGTLTLGAPPQLDGTLRMELNRTNAQTADKLVLMSGTLTNAGILTLTNIGPALVNGDTFDLLDGTLAGSFTTLNLPGGAGHWNTSDLNVGGTIVFTNAVPSANDFSLGVAVGGTATAAVIGKYAAATDADGDSIVVSAVTQGANGSVSFTGTSVTYISTNSAANDSFTYTVSDGIGGTNTKTVTVLISSPEGFNKLSGPTPIGGGQFELNYLGIPGAQYAVDEAASLTPPISWTPLATNTAASNGSITFTITPVNPSGFFRTRYVP